MPEISSLLVGEVVAPTPILPFASMTKVVAVVDPTMKADPPEGLFTAKRPPGLVVPTPTFPPKYPVPATEKAACGLVVPNPTLEFVESKLSIGMAVDEEVAKESALTPVGMVVVEDEA